SLEGAMELSQEKIPVVVIGVGEHGKGHARHFKEIEGAELAGVYDLNIDRSRQVAAELNVQAFENIEAALDAARAVSVVIPTTHHARVVHRAFDKGIDVLVEKPITRTVEEANALV